MGVCRYLKDRIVFFVINIILFLILSVFMIILNINAVFVFALFVIWFVPLIVYITLEIIKNKRFFDEILSINTKLDKKYLISEVINEPDFVEGKIFCEILKSSNRNMQEHVKYFKNNQIEYQEYIETWVHEIKTPIASLMLIVENNIDDIPNNMKSEIKKIEEYVEQVLYYSRSNDVSKDYIVKQFNLENVVRKVIRKNASDFINKKISIEIKNLDFDVYSDPKWVEFIINQIINNAIKYSKECEGKIVIDLIKDKNKNILFIKDNGIGINEKDLHRVFEKGFTGENGRIFGKSTGIGLYLCKKLANKLGLGINIDSNKEQGTQVKIIFPIGNAIKY